MPQGPPSYLYHFLVGFERCPGGFILGCSLSAGNEAHGVVLRTHLRGSQATLGPIEDAAEGWQVETTTGLWEVQSVGSSTPGMQVQTNILGILLPWLQGS